MPQVFSRNSNIYARMTFLISGLLLATVVLVGANSTSYTHDLHAALDQPAPFSHKHHANELGIDCRYCHTTVEKGPFAGIPPTETCYTCHSQIWTNSPLLQVVRDSYEKDKPIEWARVYNAPDFVYFDHSVHVAKGVSCFSCHGKIDQQNLTAKEVAHEMLWCLDCHRNPELFIRPKGEVFNPDYKEPHDHAEIGKKLAEERGIVKEQLDNCWVCHR